LRDARRGGRANHPHRVARVSPSQLPAHPHDAQVSGHLRRAQSLRPGPDESARVSLLLDWPPADLAATGGNWGCEYWSAAEPALSAPIRLTHWRRAAVMKSA